MYVISIATQKGGTGKTTTAQALAQGLNKKGRRTLLIDLDSQQAGLSAIMGARYSELNSYNVLRGKCKLAEAIQETPQGDIVPRGTNPEALGSELKAGREFRLKKALEGLKDY